MSIITRKIQLNPIATELSTTTEIYKYIKNLSSELATMGNKIIRNHVNNNFNLSQIREDKKCKKSDAIEILTEYLGTSPQNSGYKITVEHSDISSDIRTNFNQRIFKTLNENFYDIINNKTSIPSYRSNNLPIELSSKVYEKNGKYLYDFSLTPNMKKLMGEIKFELYYGKDKSNNKFIVDQTINGKYKMCNSSIKYDGSKIFLFLTVNIPVVKKEDLDQNKVMGIDLGINRLVSYYISGEKKELPQIEIANKMQHDRMRFIKERKSLQKSLKFTKGGHGRSKKTKSLENLKLRESNWAQTINHTVSKEIVNTALKYNVGTIKMEDLTGITQNKTDQFLKSWAYYQLQTYITYKAEMVGIKVEWINPKDTSIECPVCNHINKENRSTKNVKDFACVNEFCSDYGKTKDADIIASENISNRSGNQEKLKSKKGRIKKSIENKKTLVKI
jgi:IS605 OrfB family transposase